MLEQRTFLAGPISYREWLRKYYDTLREEQKYAEDNSRGRGRHSFRTSALPYSLGDLESLRTETSTAVDDEVGTLEVETPSRIDQGNGMKEAVDGATKVEVETPSRIDQGSGLEEAIDGATKVPNRTQKQ